MSADEKLRTCSIRVDNRTALVTPLRTSSGDYVVFYSENDARKSRFVVAICDDELNIKVVLRAWPWVDRDDLNYARRQSQRTYFEARKCFAKCADPLYRHLLENHLDRDEDPQADRAQP